MQIQIMLILGVIIALTGSLILGIMSWRGRRLVASTPVTQTDAPDDLSPALSGMLLAVNPMPGWKQVLATLFDLANRGMLSFTEITSPNPRDEKHFIIKKRASTSPLSGHEEGLLQTLFPTEETELPFTQLSKAYKRNTTPFTEPLKQELGKRSFLDPQRQRLRQRFSTISLILFLFSLLGIIASLFIGTTSTAWLIVFPALGLLSVCMVAFFLMTYYSPLSERGTQAARASWSFSEHLLNIASKSSHTPSSPDLFEHYLPFATSYGLLKPWIRYFRKQAPDHIPSWFETTSTTPAQSFIAFTAITLAAYTTGNTSSGPSPLSSPTTPNKTK
ncbi:DUF2207 family protein [Ktedonospora formicarum]|uniref:Predicted membrane protein YciQ-like C-terminal domain-containing protein n=1 Tax=Ktedonospora formicarum TaxID=2778364 RepID=A0A8J3MR66_9CHLR|nr:DUF2207 domain-containing protein [Ktedonospora formicarum]GHO43481.1 hypothetical protein KSX_16440 [Ktedonospora formicarum]